MTLAALAVSFGAFISAFAGGFLAIRAVRYVGIVIAVGAGIRIGAAFFDLIPEAIAYLGSIDAAMLWTAIGFLAFYAIEKLTTLHVGHETAAELDHDEAMHTHVGTAGAVGMGIHSFLDGIALAAGLAVGGGTAIVIAVVVIVHRFSDGIGVMSFLLASRVPSATAYRWLTLVAIAPVAGVLVGRRSPVESRRSARSSPSSPASSCTSARRSCCPRRIGATGRAGSCSPRSAARRRSTCSRSPSAPSGSPLPERRRSHDRA